MSFFTSTVGVGIAWAATVGSFIFAIYTHIQNGSLKKKVLNLTSINTNNENKIKSLQLALDDNSTKVVSQTGDKNVYTEKNTGGMKISM